MASNQTCAYMPKGGGVDLDSNNHFAVVKAPVTKVVLRDLSHTISHMTCIRDISIYITTKL